jgi:hypothetical protein
MPYDKDIPRHKKPSKNLTDFEFKPARIGRTHISNKNYLSKRYMNLVSICSKGDIDQLDVWYKNDSNIADCHNLAKWVMSPMDIIISMGRDKVLIWWIDHRENLPLDYTEKSLLTASKMSFVKILDLLLLYDLKSTACFPPLDATVLNDIKDDATIDFWLKCFKIKKLHADIMFEMYSTNPNVFNYWYRNISKFGSYYKIDLKITFKTCLTIDNINWFLDRMALFGACLNYDDLLDSISTHYGSYSNTSIDIRQILLRQKELNLPYSEIAMNEAKSTFILDAWRASGLELKYSYLALENALCLKDTDLLAWWSDPLVHIEYNPPNMDRTTNAIDTASAEILDLWKACNMPFHYTKKALTNAINTQNLLAIKWWCDSELELKYDVASTSRMRGYNYVEYSSVAPSNNYESIEYNITNDSDCGICLDPLNDSKCFKLICKHTFHQSCIEQYWIQARSCPYCRKVIIQSPPSPTFVTKTFANHGELITFICSHPDNFDRIRLIYMPSLDTGLYEPVTVNFATGYSGMYIYDFNYFPYSNSHKMFYSEPYYSQYY